MGAARESQRKNNTTLTAGITGAHQALTPNADSDVAPSDWMMNMIALAHARALMKLSPENRNAGILAYAHARGIAILKPGRNRTPRISFVLWRCIRF